MVSGRSFSERSRDGDEADRQRDDGDHGDREVPGRAPAGAGRGGVRRRLLLLAAFVDGAEDLRHPRLGVVAQAEVLVGVDRAGVARGLEVLQRDEQRPAAVLERVGRRFERGNGRPAVRRHRAEQHHGEHRRDRDDHDEGRHHVGLGVERVDLALDRVALGVGERGFVR